ncbi:MULTISPECIES: ATP-binding protein [Rhizobium]|uniref:ATP-binding protein n=1 Tax=Rhizobium TaxID=379 RepID=UPI00103B4BAC|nr:MULTISPECIES: ATP-binding protein [Rhizobium]NEJ17640.1 AAA family ATPase [Rhizobium ruizarguesonis]NEK31540.1 AAA family ATPase [Rhizobium ruizarguesonis]TBY24092.1 AAA family ATPase [Rhizobium leguminosarum bv. viciae]TBY34780.1 AAA family ATPase [Rhizobium leguminosarum bv. viciae]TBY93528.1 AAA family ATPase [Rhizobium leguminosarum bv. viciae]
MSFKTIYLTGAPAAGKSSTALLLMEAVTPLVVWEYGARLTEFVRDRGAVLSDQRDLRRKSANIVLPEDVTAVDELLLQFIETHRASSHVLIDSHPVTKEDYGYRITAFSLEQVGRLNPDEIWVLYTSPEVTIQRIGDNASGRPMVDIEQARFHTTLQASLAATYGAITGKPVYLFDTNIEQTALVTRLARRLV